MLVREVSVPTSRATLQSLLGNGISRYATGGIALQAPTTNAANVFFGGTGPLVAFIPPGTITDVMPVNVTSDISIYGSSGDKIIVLLF